MERGVITKESGTRFSKGEIVIIPKEQKLQASDLLHLDSLLVAVVKEYLSVGGPLQTSMYQWVTLTETETKSWCDFPR